MKLLTNNNDSVGVTKILYLPVLSDKALSLQKFNHYSFYINSSVNKKILKIFFEHKFNIRIKDLRVIKINKTFNKVFFSKKIMITIFNRNILSTLSLINNI